ncbi:MAG: DUF1674 domain-containing protein [Rhizobiaceae bacterium]
MAGKDADTPPLPEGAARKRDLPPAAMRALAEAQARRAAAKEAATGEKEIGGPKGPEPVRYGDWEIKGRAIDF